MLFVLGWGERMKMNGTRGWGDRGEGQSDFGAGEILVKL